MAFALYLAFMDRQGEKTLVKIGKAPVAASNDAVSIRDVIYFPLSMWLLVAICICFYIGIFVFIEFGKYVSSYSGHQLIFNVGTTSKPSGIFPTVTLTPI